MESQREQQVELAKELLRSEGYYFSEILHRDYVKKTFELDIDDEDIMEHLETAIDDSVYDVMCYNFQEVLEDEEINFKRWKQQL